MDLRWDLHDLYLGPDDPRRAQDRAAALERAQTFSADCRGKLVELDGPGLRDALQRYELILQLVRRLGQYSSLRFSVATDDTTLQAEMGAASEFDAVINQELAFFHVELKAITKDHVTRLVGAEVLAPYQHYLETQQIFAPFTLSEEAERTIARKDVTGKTAWVQLYQQITSAVTCVVEQDGEQKHLTRSEAMALRSHEDRDLREKATEALAASLEPHRSTLSFIFNVLFEDHRSDTVQRGFPDVLRPTVLQDDLDPAIVDALLRTVADHQSIVHRWHAARSQVLGLPDYGSQDLLAAAFGPEPELAWDQGQDLVLRAFDRFSPRVAAVIKEFFDRRWIDVAPRVGKQSGAFCSPSMPPEHPYVMLNYAGRLDDAFTLAHELGHALHFSLSLGQRPVNYWTGMPLAETASVFAEMWLQDLLEEERPDPDFQLLLLDRALGDIVRTGFHQIAYVAWERKAHAARAEGVVAPEAFSALWDAEMSDLFGAAVTRKERDRWGWIAIPHFVFARFYCYSYAFGKFLTLSLYDLWKERGDSFVRDYETMLAAGGSEAPAVLVAKLGIDLTDPGFWARGCRVAESMVERIEAAVAARRR